MCSCSSGWETSSLPAASHPCGSVCPLSSPRDKKQQGRPVLSPPAALRLSLWGLEEECCYLALEIEHSRWTFMVCEEHCSSLHLLSTLACPCPAAQKQVCTSSRPLKRDLVPGRSVDSPRKARLALLRSAFLLAAPPPEGQGDIAPGQLPHPRAACQCSRPNWTPMCSFFNIFIHIL